MDSTQDSFVAQGKRFRKALTQRVRTVKKDGTAELHAKHYFIDVNEVFRTYVPEGITFDEAEAVLRCVFFS
jgi:hypothetical protein